MATTTTPRRRCPHSEGAPGRSAIVQFYRSAIGKKWVMGVTGLMLMGFVLFHLIGNLKLFLSKDELNLYGEALRDIPGTCSATVLLWTFRLGLIAAFVFHIHARRVAHAQNRRARPDRTSHPTSTSPRIRVTHHAMDRNHRRPVRPGSTSRSPWGIANRTSSAAIRTTT